MNPISDQDFFQNSNSAERVAHAIDTMKQGKMVIMVDDEDRENEGDLVFLAEKVCADKVNFMAKEARGLICLALESSIVDSLGLPMMSEKLPQNHPDQGTAFTVSIEAKTGVTTGISAADRAQTIKVATSDGASIEDLKVPGHIFPLRANPGGVLVRAGHTEGSVDLAKLSGQKGAAVICEIMNEDGTMARRKELLSFSKKHKVPIVTIRDLIYFRSLNEVHVIEQGKAVKEQRLYPTNYGNFEARWFESIIDKKAHFTLTKGNLSSKEMVHVRVQRQHGVHDVFSATSDNTTQSPRKSIEYGLKMLKDHDHAVLVYLQSNPFDGQNTNSDWDPKLYGLGAQILKTLGVEKMCLHVNSEKNLVGLEGFGLQVLETRLMS